jgi:hypothetical protein
MTTPWSKPQDAPLNLEWMRRTTFPVETFRVTHVGVHGISLGGTIPYLVKWEHVLDFEWAPVRFSGEGCPWLRCAT